LSTALCDRKKVYSTPETQQPKVGHFDPVAMGPRAKNWHDG